MLVVKLRSTDVLIAVDVRGNRHWRSCLGKIETSKLATNSVGVLCEGRCPVTLVRSKSRLDKQRI
jgi:hypothetical protein